MNNRKKEVKPRLIDYILAAITYIILAGVIIFCILGAFLVICWYPGFAALCFISGIIAGAIRNR